MSTRILQIQRLVRSRYISICILLISSFTIYATPLPDDIKSAGLLVTDLIYKEDFKAAEDAARKLIKKYPENPAGYFFVAASLDAWMANYFDKKKEDEFYKYCDLAVEKGEKILAKNSSDEWAIFFMGGAEGYKGTYEARYERWITAFRYGWRGVSMLLKLTEMKSDISDINYGVGSYDYWRSAMINMLWFMPKIKDKREDGISKLYISAESGVLTKLASQTALVDILLNENRSQDALVYADKLLASYPQSVQATRGKARALYGIGQFAESRKLFLWVLKKYEGDEYKSTYYPVMCNYWLAKVDFAENRFDDVLKDVTAMNSYQLNDDIKKLLEKYFNEASDLKKQSASKLKK